MSDHERMGTVSGVSTIPTWTGRLVDPLNLKASDISITDIAHALARIGRFTGHTSGDHAYSVAQHSVYVSEFLPPELRLWGLLHDASEAYLNDIARPLKYSQDFAGYHEFERRAQLAVCLHFGLPVDQPPEVKVADTVLLATEFRDLMGAFCETAYYREVSQKMPSPLPRKITPWPAYVAEEQFLQRFLSLTE